MTTFTRVQAATTCQTSNRSISNWLKAFEEIHGLDGLLENNQITELGLERLEERAAIGATAYREKYQVVTSTACDETIDAEIEPDTDTAPQGITAGIVRRTQAIQANALAISRRTDELAAFEIPVTQIDDVEIDIDELRALVGLSSSRANEANAYREQADRHQAELEQLQKIQDQLDIEAIIADEQAKIEREQAIRSQVRKSLAGKEIKARAAVA